MRDRRSGQGGTLESFGCQVLREAEPRLISLHDADTDTQTDVGEGAIDCAVLQHQVVRYAVLEEHIRILATPRQGCRKRLAYQFLSDTEAAEIADTGGWTVVCKGRRCHEQIGYGRAGKRCCTGADDRATGVCRFLRHDISPASGTYL